MSWVRGLYGEIAGGRSISRFYFKNIEVPQEMRDFRELTGHFQLQASSYFT
jgi:hypothetical protein